MTTEASASPPFPAEPTIAQVADGFCLIELILRDDEPVDHRYLEVNEAFVRQTGLST